MSHMLPAAASTLVESVFLQHFSYPFRIRPLSLFFFIVRQVCNGPRTSANIFLPTDEGLCADSGSGFPNFLSTHGSWPCGGTVPPSAVVPHAAARLGVNFSTGASDISAGSAGGVAVASLFLKGHRINISPCCRRHYIKEIYREK